jgi:hypothetical protein
MPHASVGETDAITAGSTMQHHEEKSSGLGFPMIVILMAMVGMASGLVLLNDGQGSQTSRVYLPPAADNAVASNHQAKQ